MKILIGVVALGCGFLWCGAGSAAANVLDDWNSIDYTYSQTIDRTEDTIIRQRELTLTRTQTSEIVRGQDLRRRQDELMAQMKERQESQKSMMRNLWEAFRMRISKGCQSMQAARERILAVERMRDVNRIDQSIARDLVERNKYQQKIAKQIQENQKLVLQERIRDRMQKTKDMMQYRQR